MVRLEKDSEIMTENFPTWTGIIKLQIREAETLTQETPKKPTTRHRIQLLEPKDRVRSQVPTFPRLWGSVRG